MVLQVVEYVRTAERIYNLNYAFLLKITFQRLAEHSKSGTTFK